MSRRTRRPAARRPQDNSRRGGRSAADDTRDPPPRLPRPRKWLLAGAVFMQTAWIGFLIVLALLD